LTSSRGPDLSEKGAGDSRVTGSRDGDERRILKDLDPMDKVAIEGGRFRPERDHVLRCLRRHVRYFVN